MVAKKYVGIIKGTVLTSALFAAGYGLGPAFAVSLAGAGVVASCMVEGYKSIKRYSRISSLAYSKFSNYYKLSNAEKRHILRIAKEKGADVEELSVYLLDKEKKGEYRYKRVGLEKEIMNALKDF